MVMVQGISRHKVYMQIAYTDRYRPGQRDGCGYQCHSQSALHIDERSMAVWRYPESAEESSLTWQFLWILRRVIEDEENYAFVIWMS